MKILVVDEDSSVRESLCRVFEDAGYEVLLAGDEFEAASICMAQHIDLMVLDTALPLRIGWEPFERMTSRDPILPIILVTGHGDQFGLSVAAGVGAVLEKPLDPLKLLQTVQSLISEPADLRWRRVCGWGSDGRHIRFGGAVFLRKLREPSLRFRSVIAHRL